MWRKCAKSSDFFSITSICIELSFCLLYCIIVVYVDRVNQCEFFEGMQ